MDCQLNIYKKSKKNLKSLISFYLDKYDIKNDDGIKMLKEKTSLSLNQIEYIVKKLSEAYTPVFRKNLKGQITLTCLLSYGIEVLTGNEPSGSQARMKIMSEFKEFVIESEKLK